MSYSTNPYKNSVVIDCQDGDILLERQSYSVSSGNNVKVHTVLEGETIQSIAFKYYGDSGRWMDIADVNSIYNPFTDLEEGMELYIP